MSRCFQFPPPGYVWKGVCGDDLKNLLQKMKIEATRAMVEKKNEKKRLKKEEKRKVLLMKKNSPASTLTDESETQNSHDSTSSTSRNMNNKRPLSPLARDEHDSHCLIKKHKNNNTDSAAQNLPRGGASFEKAAEIESQLRELFLNWIPTRIEHTFTDPSDEDWLFGNSAKNPRTATSTSEPLVYALPYTILF